jgi:hypothetical protein
MRFLPRVELGLFDAQTALRLGDARALESARSNEVGLNSATIANTLNSSRPTGPVGSYADADAQRLSRTFRSVRSSAIARASGSDRASRSSFVTTSVSPARQAANASRIPGRSRLVPVRP